MMNKTKKALIVDSLERSISYLEYRDEVARLASLGRSTGPNQTDALANYTQLNDRRMKRFDKTVKLDDQIANQLAVIKQKLSLLVLTESWCGDAAPSMPVMNKIASLNENIDFKVLLRDDNLELMDSYLTDGARSIPKLLVIDETNNVIDSWGPRPTKATEMAKAFKEEHGSLTADFKQDLQLWYNKDKGQDILNDLSRLLLK